MTTTNPLSTNEFDDYVYRTFPELLCWYDSINCTQQHAGLCLPLGWHGLVLQLLEETQALVRDSGEESPCFRDFKDKRGYLSIHYDGGSDAIDDLVEHFEQESLITCPGCGAHSPRGGDCELCRQRQLKQRYKSLT